MKKKLVSNSKKRILTYCIIFSIAVHIAAIFSLQLRLGVFYSPINILMQLHEKTKDIAIEETKRQENVVPVILAQVQEREKTQPKSLQEPAQTLPAFFQDKSFEMKERILFEPIFSPAFAQKKIFLAKKILPTPIKADFPKTSCRSLVAEMKKKTDRLITFSQEAHLPAPTPVKEEENPIVLSKKNVHVNRSLQAEKSIAFTYKDPPLILPEKTMLELSLFSYKKIVLTPLLSRLPSLRDLATLSCANDFDCSVVYQKREDGEGYLFAVTLIPNPKRAFKKIKQNIFFVLDKSNSMQKTRLTAMRHAVAGSFSLLSIDDRYNIVAFDKNVDFFTRQLKEPTAGSFSEARKFLLKQNLGSFFSTTDIARPFYWLMSFPKKEDEINIAILLSNGDAFNPQNFHVLENIFFSNNGNFSIYSLAMSEDKNYPILDYLSMQNRGKAYAAPSLRGIKRQLQKIIHSIRFPIAKNLSAHVISQDPKLQIELYPKKHKLPHLYLDQPYVIMGSINKLEDFILFIQGRHADEWFNIKKSINFSQAKEAGFSLEKQWAVQKAYEYYQAYLQTGNLSELKKAKELLIPHDIQVAF